MTEGGFGELLRRYRIAAGLTQEELAERSGLSTRGISDLERGARGLPRKDTLQLLLKAFDLSPTDRSAFIAAARHAPVHTPQRRRADGLPPLPVSLTPLIGREVELAAVTDLLRDPAVRLISLTGAGGIGKSRLALAAAEQLVPDFPDGVIFVPLASLSDSTFVPSAIAQHLNIREAAGETLGERLSAHLLDKRMLLILDNFEHLLPAAPLVVELLALCQSLTVLATSRVRLRLRGEREVLVPPLAVPDEDGQTARRSDGEALREAIARSAAVRLFVERAQDVKGTFSLTDENAPAVAEIARRLDGLPLALELAAARIKFLSPAALLTRLDRRLPLLTGGAQDLPDRQKTLRNTIAWSYDLLPPHEQALFRRLSVFAGGWTLAAAEEVCQTAGDVTIDVLEGIAALVDHSLIREQGAADEPRLGMLETVREFGLEQLEAAGETDETCRRQGAYYVDLATRTHPLISGSFDDRSWLDLLEAEDDNLWSILSWSLESGEIEVGLRLTEALFLYWYLRKRRLTEARAWLDQALERGRLAGVCDRPLALTLTCASALAHLQADVGPAQTLAEEALAIFERIGPPHDVAWVRYVLAIPVYMAGDCHRAQQLYQEALEQFRAEGDLYWVAEVLLGVAHIAVDHGDDQGAAAAYEESLQLSQQVGSRSCAAMALSGLGFLARSRGDPHTAHRRFLESLAVWDEIDDPASIVVCLEALASTVCSLGAPQRAARLLGAAEVLREQISYPLPDGALPTYQQTIAGIQSSLSMVQFATAWIEGRSLSAVDAMALAREDPPIAEVRSAARRRAPAPWGLTTREIEVLRLLSQGLTDREIAEALFISRRTASDHVGHILRKLDARSRADAATLAVRHGLI